MANKMKPVRNLNRESQRFRLVVFVIGCFLVSMTFIVVSQPQSIPFPILGSKPSVHVASSTPKAEDTIQSQQLREIPGQGKETEQSKQDTESDNLTQGNSIKHSDIKFQDETGGELNLMTTVNDTTVNSVQKETLSATDTFESDNDTRERSMTSDESNSHGGESHGKFTLPTISNYTINDSIQGENASNAEQLGTVITNKIGLGKLNAIQLRILIAYHFLDVTETKNETEKGSTACDPNSGNCEKNEEARLLQTTNPIIVNPTQEESTSNSKQLDVGVQNRKPEQKPFCDFSHYRVDRCELEGDIRIHRNPSSVVSVETTERSESWRIRPYPRKGDKIALSRVTEVTVKSSKEGPQCGVNHDIPALVFSVGGYTGNLFHDFTDVMIPIFLSATEFNGEVQFVITETRPWWMHKFLPVFQKLSRYEIIDFDNDDRVHCFKRVIVGLRAQMEFTIDPAQDPNGYSMVDFARFMRSVYSLDRDTMTKIEEFPHRKPRLAIISRQRTRKFTNVPEIVQMAEDLGYEVVVEEADVNTNVARFAKVINTCDVLMGVHGAGLTNLVFLPLNATMIQIVPWGGLEGIAMFDFGNGAKAMKLNYVQYSISVEESTLTELYPRDHLVFKNPIKFHKRGWDLLKDTFMVKQNVKLDVNRFRKVLWKALEHMML